MLWQAHQAGRLDAHVLGVGAVTALVAVRCAAIDADVAAAGPAVDALAAGSAEVGDDALADFPAVDALADLGDDAARLVAGDEAGVEMKRGGVPVRVEVAPADPGRLHLDDDLAGLGLRHWEVQHVDLSLAGGS